MPEKILKSRKQFTSTLRTDLLEKLQKESEDTGIPFSKLLDKTVQKYFSDDRAVYLPEELYTTMVTFYETKGEDVNEVIAAIVAKYLTERIEFSQQFIKELSDGIINLDMMIKKKSSTHKKSSD